jgi:hypothetical protein
MGPCCGVLESQDSVDPNGCVVPHGRTGRCDAGARSPLLASAATVNT